MTIQTLKLGRQKFVVVPEKDFRRLREQAEGRGVGAAETDENRRDTAALRQRLAAMRRSGEKPTPYRQVRRELGLA